MPYKDETQPRCRQRGSAMVEAALALLLGLFMLIGIIDFGRILMLHQAFVQRARAGSRYSVVHDWDQDPTAAENTIRNIILYNEPDPTPRTETGLLGLQPEMVSVSREDAGGTLNDEAADRITIQISGYETFLFIPGLAGKFTAKPITHSIPVENLGAVP